MNNIAITCPKCKTRVVPTNGVCPACRQVISESDASIWFYANNGEKHGPIDKHDLLDMLRNHEISFDTLVWCKGIDNWTELLQVDALQSEAHAILRKQKANEPPPLPNENAKSSHIINTLSHQNTSSANPIERPKPYQALIFFTLRSLRALFGLIFGWQVLGIALSFTWVFSASVQTNTILEFYIFKIIVLTVFGFFFFGIRKLVNSLHVKWHGIPHPSLVKPYSL